MDRSPTCGASVDLGNRVSFYIDESLQSVYGHSSDSLAFGRGRRRNGSGALRRQASAEPSRRHSVRGDASSSRRLRRHVSDAAAMERPPLVRHGSGSGKSGRGRRLSRHESDTRRPSRNRSMMSRPSGSIRGSAYQVSPQGIDVRRQSSQRGSLKGRSGSEDGRGSKTERKPLEALDPEMAAEEEKLMAKERRHRMAVTIILATFFFLVVSSVLVVVVTLTQTTFHNAPAPSNRTFGHQQKTYWVRKENEQMMNSLNRASNNIVATENKIGGTEMDLGASDSSAAAVVTINASVMGTEERFGTSPSSSTKGTP